MFVNLSDVLTSEGMQLKKEIPLEMSVFECRGERFEITGRTPVSLVITNIEGGMELTLQAGCD